MNVQTADPRPLKHVAAGEQSTLYFTPSPEAEVALLARMLYREGYNNHNWGHITYVQPDGTILINPWEVPWDEMRASDILRIDDKGNLLSGRWTVTPAVKLHLATHRLRPDVKVALHHHSEWGTVWAAAHELPPVLFQNGASIPKLALYEEFEDTVVHDDLAEANVRAMGDADAAILANHGVFVVGESIANAHWLAVTLELRCKVAWRVRAMGAEGVPLKQSAVDALIRSVRKGIAGSRFHHAMIRREVLADPSVLT
ncbi:MAG: class II aldolase/adducin family protein [Novosphingobium sp.]|nr:class II aldolase/adducin family protein [Novosphingobium sp.]